MNTSKSIAGERTQLNDKRRHEIIGLTYTGDKYDIRHFEGLSAFWLLSLIDEGFADPNEKQNDCPSIAEIAEFLKANSDFTAHGYIVTPNRDDCRVSLEGVDLRSILRARGTIRLMCSARVHSRKEWTLLSASFSVRNKER